MSYSITVINEQSVPIQATVTYSRNTVPFGTQEIPTVGADLNESLVSQADLISVMAPGYHGFFGDAGIFDGGYTVMLYKDNPEKKSNTLWWLLAAAAIAKIYKLW